MKSRAIKLFASIVIISSLISCTNNTNREIKILVTNDIHGNVLPYDFIEKRNIKASLASASTYIENLRKEDNTVLLLDNGDNLQGQPEVYYYNYIDTLSPHFQSEVMNYMRYDAGTLGNHDIETGHSVYDRLVKSYNFPLLASNAIEIKTGKPYFKPYAILKRNGLKIAIFGLIIPTIPDRLAAKLYSGIEFRDMLETAKLWMPVIKNEKPDLIIGLFHSGWDPEKMKLKNSETIIENGSSTVAYNVPGFDVIFAGHDHNIVNKKVVNIDGDTVLILEGGSKVEKLSEADIIIRQRKNKKISGNIINVADYGPSEVFISKFASVNKIIDEYSKRIIGKNESEISSRDAYFGSSAFVDMIHSIQLNISEADISFAAPLSFDVKIPEGDITVGDMFKLYRFENLLYTIKMSGEEIKRYLEFSYSQWLNTMKNKDDYLLKYRTGSDGKPILVNGRLWLKNQAYDFDSATGIDYTVDVRKPEGHRIIIKSLTDGRPFEKDLIYKVAINSSRANGGGRLISEGAGISRKELQSRIISSTKRDMRYYIMEYVEHEKKIYQQPVKNWKIIPEEWVKSAKLREYPLLFGSVN
jgi:2',3'-cyclic-nucleotide 2'-phosphodiesterase / 3'-nucleotidase